MDHQFESPDGEWDDIVFERYIIFDPDAQRWAVRPSDGDILAHFDSRDDAIDYAYDLATQVEKDWCDIAVFDEAGVLLGVIDPEQDLEYRDKLKELLCLDQDGELTFIEDEPSEEFLIRPQ
jgi:hypothetical protein